MTDDKQSFLASLSRQDGWADLTRARIERLDEGMSGASVFRVTEKDRPPRYLKVAHGRGAAALRDEIARTRWLAQHKIRVPEILRADDRAGRVALLMSAVPGIAAGTLALPVDRLMDALARAFKSLHALPARDCPFDERVAVRLARAAAAVEAGEVDPEHFAERHHGVAPEALLARLTRERPVEDIVVVHGDATLSNIFVDRGGNVGFIDCGNAGRADRYTDLAVLMADIEDHYGIDAAARFAREYGAPAGDSGKARYFQDLYELF